MATNLPAKLRTADISRFMQRGAQLEKIKPPIAYWCYYWVVNQILAKGLHNADEGCMNYTTELVDRLEKFKTEYASMDAVVDDTAGQAYVEQFSLETFQRADNAVRANKASRQTAETFQAAATFLELVQIWNPPNPDIASKIKYAKYHALRIAKALKAGEDPNLSNPEPEVRLEDETQPLDPNDPDVQKINAAAAAAPNQPFVEEIPDEQDVVQRNLAVQSSIDQSLHPSRASSLPRPATETPPAISPLPPTEPDAPLRSQDETPPFQDAAQNPRHNSIGGGYFPEIPSDTHNDAQMPDLAPQSLELSVTPSAPMDDPQDFYNIPSPTPGPTIAPAAPFSPQLPRPESRVPPASFSYKQPSAPPSSYFAPPPAAPSRSGPETYNTDDEAILLAQKHAKWAISALNFEDVPTAVKELRIALKALGVQ